MFTQNSSTTEERYFLTYVVFDKEHHGSNIFGHLGVVLLKAKKNNTHHLENLELVCSYGYNSHRIPEAANLKLIDRILKKFAHVNFRIHGSYAELKQETDIDLGFGLTCGPIVEINPSEKQRFEEYLQEALSFESEFFKCADLKAKDELKELPEGKEKNDRLAELQNYYRELYYENELNKADLIFEENDLMANLSSTYRSFKAGLISKERLTQEKLAYVKRVKPFCFSLNQEASTCKPLGIQLMTRCLDDSDSGLKRKAIFTKLIDGQYTTAFPKFTKHLKKIVFDTTQKDKYLNAIDGYYHPQRTQSDNCSTNVLATSYNNYYDLNGTQQELHPISDNETYINCIENLVFLKRFLNIFTNDSMDFNFYIKMITDYIKKIMQHAHNVVIMNNIYETALRALYENNCFNSIEYYIFKTDRPLHENNSLNNLLDKQGIVIERGVKAEINRLKTLSAQAQKLFKRQSVYEGTKSKFFNSAEFKTTDKADIWFSKKMPTVSSN